MKLISSVVITVFILVQISYAIIYNVTTNSELIKALNSVNPGDTIILADGYYIGKFLSVRSGTKEQPITLTGSKLAILTSKNQTDQGNAFYLNSTSYWILNGFSVYNSAKGILIDSSNHILINDVYVHQIGQEGVHFRSNSCDNTLQNSTIAYTGRTDPGYGEAVYIGSAVENWINEIADLSNRNRVINNKFGPYIGAEAIDIKVYIRLIIINNK